MRGAFRLVGFLAVSAGCGLVTGGRLADPPDAGGGGPDGAQGDAGANDTSQPDAPSADTSPSDASDAGSDSSAACPHLFCEDFETPIDARWHASTNNTNGTVGRDMQRAHTGAWALHTHTDGLSSGQKTIAVMNHDGVLPAHFFLRYFFWRDAPSTMNTQNIGEVALLDGSEGMVAFTRDNGDFAISPFHNGNAIIGGAFPTPPGWICIEWEIEQAEGGTTSTQNVWRDGMPIITASSVPWFAFDTLDLGLAIDPANAQGATDQYYDDVAIDVTMIGCH